MPKHGERVHTDHEGYTTTRTPVAGNPELVVLSTSGRLEFRVYNYRTLASGRTVRGDGWGLTDFLVVAWLLWSYMHAGSKHTGPLAEDWVSWLGTQWPVTTSLVLCLVWVWSKTTTVLYQSVTPLPTLGLQLSTTRGISFRALWLPRTGRTTIPLSISRTFIPLSEISTIIINESLRRWSVRYYLAVLKKGGESVVVAFDEVMPRHPVLKEVYHSLREILFDEWEDGQGNDDISTTRITKT